MNLFRITLFLVFMTLISCKNKKQKQSPIANTIMTDYYKEPYRPQFHFSPEKHWMNDPNGMVYHQGVYHLFYQYYPNGIVWGPMHWGHATSQDLIHWSHKPIALYPDEQGMIFSGSAVVDKNNSSGFGTLDNPPLVAIFTYHDAVAKKDGASNYETQGLAYSIDNGDTWLKYKGNPILENDGLADFRDPKVMWHAQSNRWIMTLVAGDHAQFFSSTDLKDWTLVGTFGENIGAHGGVWECPDLFPLLVEGASEEKWVLLISINPGAPNGGSGTQYFIGDFDGKKFTSNQVDHKWIDWGTDNYAGVTYDNAPNGERVFIGWMSNWLYANETPTEKWRSAMTIPRILTLKKSEDGYYLNNYPLKSFAIAGKNQIKKNIEVAKGATELISFKGLNQAELRFKTNARNFQLHLNNTLEEEVVISLNGDKELFYIDRSISGKKGFQKDFANIQQMPIPQLPKGEYEVRLLIDHSSIEIFINKGQYVMTVQVFPNKKYTNLIISNLSAVSAIFKNVEVNSIRGTW